MCSDGCYFELHAISGEGAGLVGEDMLDLSEFFIEGSTPNKCSFLSVLAEHELILVDEVALSHFDYFHGDDERDGYHGVDEDKIGEQLDDPFLSGGVAPLNVGISISVAFGK